MEESTEFFWLVESILAGDVLKDVKETLMNMIVQDLDVNDFPASVKARYHLCVLKKWFHSNARSHRSVDKWDWGKGLAQLTHLDKLAQSDQSDKDYTYFSDKLSRDGLKVPKELIQSLKKLEMKADDEVFEDVYDNLEEYLKRTSAALGPSFLKVMAVQDASKLLSCARGMTEIVGSRAPRRRPADRECQEKIAHLYDEDAIREIQELKESRKKLNAMVEDPMEETLEKAKLAKPRANGAVNAGERGMVQMLESEDQEEDIEQEEDEDEFSRKRKRAPRFNERQPDAQAAQWNSQDEIEDPTQDVRVRKQPLSNGAGMSSPRTIRDSGRRHTRRWTMEESELLVDLVTKYGKGKWKEILAEGGSGFEGRTTVDLKDKFRNLEKHLPEKEAS